MSGLCGILRFDHAPVDAAAVDAMARALAHRGPDGTRRWTSGPVGMAHLEHRTAGPGRHGRQPLADPDGEVVVTLDGRIDDRASVLAALGPARDLLRDATDGELVLRAYLTWGRSGLGRLVGDFAVAIWDGRRHELLCARDALGSRPLLYLRDRRPGVDALRWGSEVVALLADPAVRRTPNPGMVAEILAQAITSTTETVYDGILRVPPAHLLVARLDGQLTVERHWSWDPAAAVPRSRTRAHDAQHVEELRAVFAQAVGDRLTAEGPVAAELSGGVDSSFVVATAANLLLDQGRPPLELFSLVRPDHPQDESHHARAVAAHLGRSTHEHPAVPLGPVPYDEETRRTLLPAGSPNLAMHLAPIAQARELGCRVVLTGQGGDEWFTGSRYAYADDLRHRHLRGFRARAAADARLWGARSPARQLVRDGILPLVGRVRRPPPRADLLPRSFVASVGLADRIRRPALRGRVLAAAHVAEVLDDGARIHAVEHAERAYSAIGVERRSPFDDRRVVELALRLPDDLLRRGLSGKWIVRAAMEGLVPEQVRRRGDKADFMHLFAEELELRGGPAPADHLALADLGWADLAVLRRGWETARTAHQAGRNDPLLWSLWSYACAERWLGSTLTA